MAQLELDGRSIHYEQSGSGPDLVLIAGGGGRLTDWRWQVPYLEREFRVTRFDNRGIGGTSCDEPLPWTIGDMARDAAELIEALCDHPVAAFGQSMGGFIVTQLALDRPDLLRCAIASGTSACGGDGWLGDYMRAEIDLRRRGGRLDGMFAVTHYAAELYPARVLGDPVLWPTLRDWLLDGDFSEANEASLIPQWQACVDFDVVDRLPSCQVPLHVFAYQEDVQAPPQYGRRVAELAPRGELHFFDGLGHGSLRGHAHDRLNPVIAEIVRRYYD